MDHLQPQEPEPAGVDLSLISPASLPFILILKVLSLQPFYYYHALNLPRSSRNVLLRRLGRTAGSNA